MKKQILSLFMAVVIMLGILPIVSASETESSSTITAQPTTRAAKKGYVVRKTSDLGVSFIEAFEGYYQFQYWDYQHYTIGYGTTCEKDEYPGGIDKIALLLTFVISFRFSIFSIAIIAVNIFVVLAG